MEDWVQVAQRKALLISTFVERFKTITSLITKCLFADSLLIVSYVRGAVGKEQGADF